MRSMCTFHTKYTSILKKDGSIQYSEYLIILQLKLNFAVYNGRQLVLGKKRKNTEFQAVKGQNKG